jgi:hypothetical protein
MLHGLRFRLIWFSYSLSVYPTVDLSGRKAGKKAELKYYFPKFSHKDADLVLKATDRPGSTAIPLLINGVAIIN